MTTSIGITNRAHSVRDAPDDSAEMAKRPPIWWSNASFFVTMHVAALYGVKAAPLFSRPWQTLALCFVSWQLAVFGITIGYHRLFSHRSFTAKRSLRLALALMGCLGFQGSIKWWCARHRLHHRYTDTEHDPYNAKEGLFYSHMGWIFYKPQYPRLPLVDRSDLDRDPVVQFQHRYYLFLTLGLGLVLPTVLAFTWNDTWGGLVWGGIVARLMIWHCTFIVNSFAHWEGLQPYSDEVTARGNMLMAMLTGGEGNHNYHAFPYDYRAGPTLFEWDPSKWIIRALYDYTGLVTSLKTANDQVVAHARHTMSKPYSKVDEHDGHDDYEEWDLTRLRARARCASSMVLLIDGYVLDLTKYKSEHPGGFPVLSKYAIMDNKSSNEWAIRDASWAFNGGLNNHSRAAKRLMRGFIVARAGSDVIAAVRA